MKHDFYKTEPFPDVPLESWQDSGWQIRKSFKTQQDFESYFVLSPNESEGFQGLNQVFRVQATPYYVRLASPTNVNCPIRKIILPQKQELELGAQQMLDPLGENQNRPARRIIHRYQDRVLFLVTDFCSVYCRYCTRKHFTGQDQVFPKSNEYQQALEYIKTHPEICEVILSGGDPLTLSNSRIEQVLSDVRSIDHVEIIRVGSRMPTVCPMRVSPGLVEILKKYSPLFFMTHFNHPKEITFEAKQAIDLLVDNGIPVFNQMVFLKGVNDNTNTVRTLNRKLLYCRVKPYYMFQCDPSMGTDHLRTTIASSEKIQRELWGHSSGLSMPNLSVDIPGGGGKVALVPNFELNRGDGYRSYRGFDGIESQYIDPKNKEYN